MKYLWLTNTKWSNLTKSEKRYNLFWMVSTTAVAALHAYRHYKSAETIMLLEEENLALAVRNAELSSELVQRERSDWDAR